MDDCALVGVRMFENSTMLPPEMLTAPLMNEPKIAPPHLLGRVAPITSDPLISVCVCWVLVVLEKENPVDTYLRRASEQK